VEPEEAVPADGAALTAALAEYTALRSEIEWLIAQGAQLQNYAIGITLGLFPTAAFILEKRSSAFLAGLLIFAPIALSLLGLLYFRQHQEVYVVGAYLSECVAPIIRELGNRDDLWTWEDFKAARQTVLSNRSHALGIWRPRTILLLRLAVFTLPAVCCFVLGVSIAIAEGMHALLVAYTTAGTVVLLVLAVIDVAVIGLLGLRFWTEGDLAVSVLAYKPPSARPHP
jgi:hypothetical protein